MHTLILHHYEISPYSEKIRLIFGLKGLAWKSVQVPMVMPKDDLTAVTGGYRKAPVLQIGADVYCDTKTIARVLDRIAPSPTLFPKGSTASERALSSFGDTMFMAGVIVLLASDGVLPPEFLEDRKKMLRGGIDLDQVRAVKPCKRAQVRSYLAALDAQLADGRPYLLGNDISLADFSVYHPVWFLSTMPVTAELVAPFAHIARWRDRLAELGHGERSEMTGAEAIEIARTSKPATEPRVDAGDVQGLRAGDQVMVVPEDFGLEVVQGELVASDADEIALRHRDPRAGERVIHFPRQGYLVMRAA